MKVCIRCDGKGRFFAFPLPSGEGVSVKPPTAMVYTICHCQKPGAKVTLVPALK